MEFARAKFEEDINEGLMLKMSLGDFKAKYGEHRAIAALAVIVDDELVGKKRMIHDASHGVRVNHRIRCRDKIRAPGAREKKQLLREMMEAREVVFSVVGDIAKAHRRFKHREEEHGYLGCQIDTKEEIEAPRLSTSTRWAPSASLALATGGRGSLPPGYGQPTTCQHRSSCGKKGDTAKLLLHVAVRLPLQVG